jgi:nucleoside-diphosphate-sugar epimerase
MHSLIKLQRKRVFITGITSPLGCEIAGLLIDSGADVTGLVRNKSRSSPDVKNIKIVEGDCEHADSYRAQVLANSFIIHAAGLRFSSEIIRSCAGNDQLERIIFISSMRVCYPDHLLSGEERAGKRVLLEKEDEISSSLLPWTILRPTLIYSRGDRSFSRVRRLMSMRRVFPMPGRGDATRQPISARDLAASTVKALLSPAAHQKTYNLPGDKIRIREILEILSEEMDLSVKLISVPELPVRMVKRICNLLGLDRHGATLTSFLRWYHDFDWAGVDAAVDLGHNPRSFRQNVHEQIASEEPAHKTVRRRMPR